MKLLQALSESPIMDLSPGVKQYLAREHYKVRGAPDGALIILSSSLKPGDQASEKAEIIRSLKDLGYEAKLRDDDVITFCPKDHCPTKPTWVTESLQQQDKLLGGDEVMMTIPVGWSVVTSADQGEAGKYVVQLYLEGKAMWSEYEMIEHTDDYPTLKKELKQKFDRMTRSLSNIDKPFNSEVKAQNKIKDAFKKYFKEADAED